MPTPTLQHRMIVVGASAGGVDALGALARGLPADLPAALLVVLHVGSYGSVLPRLLRQRGRLPAEHAHDGEPIRAGRIYVAPPDHHMLVHGERIELTRGAKEHHTRPAIDPLFISAALQGGPDVVGVVLTGALDDGTAGLHAVKRCGGIAVVQDPADAEVQDMPRSALRHVQVDHCLPLAALPALLERLARRATAAQPWQPPHELAIELALMRKRRNGMHRLNEIGTPSTFVCPECHGTLWALHGSELPRFRCHTGHAYTLRTLQHALALASDEANWNALRALAERGELLQRLAERYRADGEALAARHAEQAAHAVQHQQQTLRELIERSPVAPE